METGTLDRTLQSEWVCAASYSRLNGSGSSIVNDEETRSWLLILGTWFHASNLASGQEQDLLRLILSKDISSVCTQLEGFFVLIYGDQVRRELHVVTDIVGSCHAFFSCGPYFSVISSSSLMIAALTQAGFDPIGFQEFLATGVVYQDRTLFRDVKKFPAAIHSVFGRGKVNSSPYWKFSSLNPESLQGEKAVNTFSDVITNALQRIGKSHSRIVSDLTSGYDSRLLLAAIRSAKLEVATTVTGKSDVTDVVRSKQIANTLELRHRHIFPLENPSAEQIEEALVLSDGEYDVVEYANVANVHKMLSGEFGISLNGSFGEVARGYWWELLHPALGKSLPLNSAKVARARYAVGDHRANLILPDSRLALVEHFTRMIDETLAGLTDSPNNFQMDVVYLRLRMQRWQGRIASSTNRIWPCVSPFMFKSVLETMLQIENKLRQRSLLVRKVIERLSKELAMVPLEHGYPAVPVNWRNWTKFWPVPLYYGGRVLDRFRRKLRLKTSLPPLQWMPFSDRESWEAFQLTLVAHARLLNPTELTNVCSLVKAHQLPSRGQFSRLFTLYRLVEKLQTIGRPLPSNRG